MLSTFSKFPHNNVKDRNKVLHIAKAATLKDYQASQQCLTETLSLKSEIFSWNFLSVILDHFSPFKSFDVFGINERGMKFLLFKTFFILTSNQS